MWTLVMVLVGMPVLQMEAFDSQYACLEQRDQIKAVATKPIVYSCVRSEES